MNIIETSTWEKRPLTVTWHEAPFIPPHELVTQVSGLCFTNDGSIVLVSCDGETWQLAGGHPEANETIEDAFIREAAEEASATVTKLAYLGAQEVNDPLSPTEVTTYFQVRFWTRVTLDEFRNTHETLARKCVEFSAVKAALNWHTTRILDAIMQTALDYEQQAPS
jgi:8-oxo-dGTP pyrophosphatase MutT (NUDIX family)